MSGDGGVVAQLKAGAGADDGSRSAVCSLQNSSGLLSVGKMPDVEEKDANVLYPYRLFGPSSYFGDMECMSGCMRQSTLRCEKAGTTLLLRKKDLTELIDEFPQFGEAWISSAWRREGLRTQALKRLTERCGWVGLDKESRSHKHLAACTIQRRYRETKHLSAKPRMKSMATASLGSLQMNRLVTSPDLHGIINTKTKTRQQLGGLSQSNEPVLKEVSKLQRSVAQMHAEMKEYRNDMKEMKQALTALAPKGGGSWLPLNI